MPEDQNTEWKESWRDEYLKGIVAFANTNGGTLFIGVDDRGKVKGLDDAEKLLEKIPNKIKEHLGVLAEVSLLDEGNKKYLKIDVEAYPNPISYKGHYYLRSRCSSLELK